MPGKQPISAAVTSTELLEDFERALAHPNEIFGYGRYGDGKRWAVLDELTGGLQGRTFTVLASRPKVGKSMLASAWVPFIAEQALMEERVVRIVSLEMSRKAYQRRMAAIMAGIKDPKAIRKGTLDKLEQRRYRSALAQLAALPIEYLAVEKALTEEEALKYGNSPITFKDVEAFIQGPRPTNTFWWMLDHIGLLNDLDGPGGGDMNRSIYTLANKLAGLAHKVAAGLIITHLNRASVGGMPSIESIAGSDQVGRNADQIFLLTRPFFELGELSEEDQAIIDEGEPAFLKFISRDEGSGMDVLLWDKERATFDEMQLAPGAKVRMPGSRTGTGPARRGRR